MAVPRNSSNPFANMYPFDPRVSTRDMVQKQLEGYGISNPEDALRVIRQLDAKLNELYRQVAPIKVGEYELKLNPTHQIAQPVDKQLLLLL